MLYIAQNANGKWLIANRATRKAVANPYGPGRAIFDTKEAAEAAMDDAMAAYENDC